MIGMSVPCLHLIGPLDGVLSPESYADVAELAAEGGVDAIHVRLPGRPGGEIMSLALDVAARLDPSAAMLCVNDRIDVALLLGAGGIHLGERSLSVWQARQLVGEGVLIGRSVHDTEGAIGAQGDGANYVIAGHVFATESKPGQPGRGPEWISELARVMTIPIIAIGGITRERVQPVIEAGAWGVAVGREILSASDPTAAAQAIRDQIEQE